MEVNNTEVTLKSKKDHVFDSNIISCRYFDISSYNTPILLVLLKNKNLKFLYINPLDRICYDFIPSVMIPFSKEKVTENLGYYQDWIYQSENDISIVNEYCEIISFHLYVPYS